MQCPRCQHENRPGAQFCEKCGAPVTGADPTARPYADLKSEVESLRRSQSEALEQQTATSEILRVISSSPTDVQPVFDTIAERAMRLCGGQLGTVITFDGELMHLAALANYGAEGADAMRRAWPLRPDRGSAFGRTVLTKAVVHIPSLLDDPEYAFGGLAQVTGFRSVLHVPMLKDGRVIGAVGVARLVPGLFSDREIALLQTFADQAVIAIENVRLFNETKEALEQQTATADILRVISSSPVNLQSVFDTIVSNAVRLCGAAFGGLNRLEGNRITLDAHYGVPADELAILQRDVFPLPVSRESATGRAILDRAVIHIRDIRDDPNVRTPRVQSMQGYRTFLAVPMLRDGIPIGVLALWRREVQPFTDRETAIVRTFADQAVIAIENVRLFKELEEKNRALTAAHAQVTEALEQQTATAEILRVISQSQTDLQPVFEVIARSAVQLCEATFAALQRFDGQVVTFDAHYGMTEQEVEASRHRFPLPAERGTAVGRAILDRRTTQIQDIRSDPEYRVSAGQTSFRTVLAVPLLREGVPIGAIGLWRREVQPFSEKQIKLVETFADQAVIAIENVRLFKELEARTQALTRSVGELRALGEVGRAVSSTLDLQTVLTTIVARATQLAGVDAGVIYEYDEQGEVFVPRATERLEAAIVETLIAAPVRKGEGATGRLAEAQEPIQLWDILEAPAESRVRETLGPAGYRALLAVPLVRENHLLGGLTVFRRTPGEFAPEVIDLLRTFATQSALAIQNARLFKEIEDKSRQLEVASQHKSEFLANRRVVIGRGRVVLRENGPNEPKSAPYSSSRTIVGAAGNCSRAAWQLIAGPKTAPATVRWRTTTDRGPSRRRQQLYRTGTRLSSTAHASSV